MVETAAPPLDSRPFDPPAPSVPRLVVLDLLRAVAVLLVMGRHLSDALPPMPRAVRGALELWRHTGWVGVDLFFVLSGFLVSGLLFREYQTRGHMRIGRFLVRRGFKIYPAFYAFLVATAIYRRHDSPPIENWLDEIFFLQNYGPSLWPHTWSLAVEEHFYLLLALAFVVIARRGRDFSLLPPAIAVVGLSALTARVLGVLTNPVSMPLYRYRFATHLRIDSLAFGVLLSYWYHFDNERLTRFVTKHRLGLAIAIAAALSPALVLDVDNPLMITVGLTLLYLGFGGVLLLSLIPSRPERAGALVRAAGWIGTYSYSIYLWHFAVQHLTEHIADRALALAIYLVGSFVIAVSMAKIIERPFLALRDRLT